MNDVFGRSSRSITEQILAHPGKTFDVTPFVHGRCKTPIEEIQAAVDGAISPEQAVKLRQCLDHIDELEKHIETVEQEILRRSDPYGSALILIRTVPGFDRNPMTAIQVLDWIGRESGVDDDLICSTDKGTALKILSIARFWMANPDKTIRRIEEPSFRRPYRIQCMRYKILRCIFYNDNTYLHL